jgi:hypothetical protein
MALAELGEYLFGGPGPAVSDVVLALPEGFVHVRAGSSIEQSLTLFRFRWRCRLLVLLQINSQSDWLNQVQWKGRARDH